jgi:hypothetical protein
MSYGFIPLYGVIGQLKSKKFILIFAGRPPDDPIAPIHPADGSESFFLSLLNLSFRS